MKEIDWDMFVAECVKEPEKAFPPVGDFHAVNASSLYGFGFLKNLFTTDYKTYKDRYRDTAKRVGLALLYGSSYRNVEAPTEAEQKKLFANFFIALKGFKKHLTDIETRAKKNLYTTNFFGARIWLKDLNHKDSKIAFAVKRKMFNYPIQSVGAEIILLAMYRIMKYTEINDMNKFANDNIHKAYYNRIVSVPRHTAEQQDFINAIEALPEGNIALCIQEGTELTDMWDRYLAIDTDFIEKWGLSIFH